MTITKMMINSTPMTVAIKFLFMVSPSSPALARTKGLSLATDPIVG